jgi:glycosyltransferase involved in cell wall biosynthesis
MDLTLVSSNHAKKVFEDSRFEEKNNQTGQVVRDIKLEKPVEVLFEGVDTNIFKKLDNVEGEVNDILNDLVEEEFNFLYVGHWLQGELGEDRKNTGMLIKTFLETFKNQKQKPGLILKTSAVDYSVLDREDMLDKIRKIQKIVGNKDELPNIYLLHGELSNEEINELYNHSKVKAHISFTKGEGYGRPLLEASISQKPVIASDWSGHLDFLNSDMSVLLPGELKQVHPSAAVQDMILPESAWFTVDYKKASETIEDIYKNYKKYLDGAKRQAYRSRTDFNLEKMSEKIVSILDERIPKPVQLKLPQLKKIELPKLKKVD